jgi:esterase/lipase
MLWGDPARDDDFLKSYRLAYSVGKGSLWQYMMWAPRMAELLSLIGKARRCLRLLRMPVLIIQSRRDETVSWKSARMLERSLRPACAVDVLLLERSGHSYHHPEEASMLQEKICGFVKGCMLQNE